MKKVYLSLLCLLVFACKKETTDVPYEAISYQLLHDEIMTTMPGDLIIADKYLVWTDPFARDYFVHVHDRNSGEEIGVMGRVGKGPEEFITGGISTFCIDNKFYATDANGNTRGYLSIDSLLQKKKTFIPISEKERKERPQLTQLQKDVFIQKTEDGSEHYFMTTIKGKETTFGVYPIPEVRQHLGGAQAYDSISGFYSYSSYKFPYLALYKKEGNTFQLQWENKPDNQEYEIISGQLVFDPKVMGIFELCMSKDYIVALQRDRKRDPIDESTLGRNASKCPHTVFLYNYDGDLVKIVDLGMPVIRIAADRRSNTLYAIGVDPDYVLVKYDL